MGPAKEHRQDNEQAVEIKPFAIADVVVASHASGGADYELRRSRANNFS